MHELDKYVTSIPDFPEPGIIFRDITSVLSNPQGLKLAIEEYQKLLDGIEFDAIVGLESRGFIFGMPIAYNMGKGFIPIRKKGKLPRETVEQSYELEYGTATIEIHKEDIKPGMKVVIVDDLIATGGTLEAATKLLEKLGAEVVKIVCLLELKGLEGRKKIANYPTECIIAYDGK